MDGMHVLNHLLCLLDGKGTIHGIELLKRGGGFASIRSMNVGIGIIHGKEHGIELQAADTSKNRSPGIGGIVQFHGRTPSMLEGISHLKHAVRTFRRSFCSPHAGKPSVGRIFVEVVIRDLRGMAIGRREDHFAHQRFGDPRWIEVDGRDRPNQGVRFTQ